MLNKQANNQELWQDHHKAKDLLQHKEALNRKLAIFKDLLAEFNENKELLLLAVAENELSLIKQSQNNLKNILPKISLANITALFNGEADQNASFIEIHPGAGGTESQDWAEMLFRMYVRWAEHKKANITILDEQKGDEAGVKSVTMKISLPYAYGWLKNESGVHRLVRISPFNSNGKRMTSFASIWVYPEISEEINIEIQDKDLRIDTYRASGAGGQHVNKTDSAIRITHIPSNIVVQCQNSRSQHRNRSEAMKMLKSRLYQLELSKKQDQIDQENAGKTDIGWGNQIRSYVMQPYQMVKDLRSNFETANISKILDGELDQIMISLLTK